MSVTTLPDKQVLSGFGSWVYVDKMQDLLRWMAGQKIIKIIEEKK
jgi:hypothetical protein